MPTPASRANNADIYSYSKNSNLTPREFSGREPDDIKELIHKARHKKKMIAK